jgi:hypothetical protein
MEDDTNGGFCWAFCCLERVLLVKRRKNRGWPSVGFALALSCCLLAVAACAQTSDAAPKTSSPKAKSTKAAAKKSTSKTAAKKTTSTSTKTHTTGRKTTSTSAKSGTPAPHGSKSRYASSRKGSKKTTARGQQKIDSERAEAIQEALIREHYLSGEAAGSWNQSSEDAMRRYQADHGWQSKTVPDSRALISLGLGPSHDHLLNPESAMTTGPFPTHGDPMAPVSHSADTGSSSDIKPTVSDPAAAASSPTVTPAHDAPNPQ